MTEESSLSAVAAAASERLAMQVAVVDHGDRVPPGSRWRAVARSESSRTIEGYAAASTARRAESLSIIECAERWAQFGWAPDPDVRARASVLGPEALDVASFGLYSPEQYATPGFDLVPFDPEAPREWLSCRPLDGGQERLVPIEFVHPNAGGGTRLVAETSSGTAAHTSASAATLAALCEVIERDAALLLWHRGVPARRVAVGSIIDDDAREAIETVRASGCVVMLLALGSDVAVPAYLALALRGTGFITGLGCHPDARTAQRRAVHELTHRFIQPMLHRSEHLALHAARSPEGHSALYDGGPLHPALRSMVAVSCRATASYDSLQSGPGDVDGALAAVLGSLEARRRRVFVVDLSPPELRATGLHVVRALVPGLVPLYFGYDRLRLGCERLTGPDAPGRLQTLLPHPFS